MKGLLLVAIVFFPFLAIDAQNARVVPQTFTSKWKLPDLNVIDEKTIERLNAENFIASLKQDRMPCIIPLKPANPIPNIYRKEIMYPNKIPNAWKPDTLAKQRLEEAIVENIKKAPRKGP